MYRLMVLFNFSLFSTELILVSIFLRVKYRVKNMTHCHTVIRAFEICNTITKMMIRQEKGQTPLPCWRPSDARLRLSVPPSLSVCEHKNKLSQKKVQLCAVLAISSHTSCANFISVKVRVGGGEPVNLPAPAGLWGVFQCRWLQQWTPGPP